MEFRKCEGTLRALFSEIDQRGRAGCGESRQSGSVGGMRRRTIRQRALSLPNWGTPISALLNSPTVSGGFLRPEKNVCRIQKSHQLTRYCWPTPKYRNWCAQHACFEGKKVEKTSPRKSTPRTLKEVGQQYPPLF